MKVSELPLRVSDDWGKGHYGASRGNRKHIGTDFLCTPNETINSHVSGKVTRLGYPYADNLSYRYVEVTSSDGLRHRWFYVSPRVREGDAISAGDTIGIAQDVAAKYKVEAPSKHMGNHVHYEVLSKDGSPNDPMKYI